MSDQFTTTYNIHKGKTTRYPAEFEPTIPERERPQTHSLGRAATGIGYTVGIRIPVP